MQTEENVQWLSLLSLPQPRPKKCSEMVRRGYPRRYRRPAADDEIAYLCPKSVPPLTSFDSPYVAENAQDQAVLIPSGSFFELLD